MGTKVCQCLRQLFWFMHRYNIGLSLYLLGTKNSLENWSLFTLLCNSTCHHFHIHWGKGNTLAGAIVRTKTMDIILFSVFSKFPFSCFWYWLSGGYVLFIKTQLLHYGLLQGYVYLYLYINIFSQASITHVSITHGN